MNCAAATTYDLAMRIPVLMSVVVSVALLGCSSKPEGGGADLSVVSGVDLAVPVAGEDLTTPGADLIGKPTSDLTMVATADLAVTTMALLGIDHQPQYDFGTVVVGQTSGFATFTISNSGDGTSGIVGVTFGGTNAADFLLVRNDCNVMLAPGTSCSVDVALSSSAAGGKTATLLATASSGGTASVTLLGTVVTPGAISVTPASVPFGSIVINTTQDQLVTLKNEGGAETGAMTFTTEGSNGAEFSVVNGGTCVSGAKLAAGAMCTLMLRWAPLTPGVKTASFVVNASPGGPGVATLSGTALTASMLSFTSSTYTPLPNTPVNKGSTATITLTLVNNGTQDSGALPAIATMTNTVFTVVGGTCAAGTPVPGGGSCTIIVEFAPTGFGAASDSLSVTASPGGTASAALTAVGEETFTLTVNRAGNGTGTVNVDAVPCATFPCVVSYTMSSGTAPDVTVTATADVSSTAGVWTSTPSVGSCTGATCQVTMNQSRGATVTFTKKKFNVTIGLVGVRGVTGTVAANVAPALVCSGASCTGSYDYGTNVTLTASGSGGALFQSWAATPCASRFTASCATGALTADFATSVTFRPAINYAFVSSASIDVTTIGANLLVADRFCDTLARDAGLVNTPSAPDAPYFKALLATTTASARSRIDMTKGWIRPDGKEIASDPKDLFNESGATNPYQLFHSLDRDESGVQHQYYVATGATRDGLAVVDGTCRDWTAAPGCAEALQVGNSQGGNGMWLAQQRNCSCGSWPIYCFETAQPATTIAPSAPAQKRVAFVSNGMIDGAAGRAAADTLCATEASSATLSGTFVSLLPLTASAASARFDTGGANWVRPDNVPIAATPTAFMSAIWDAPFTQLANGSYAMVANQPTWVGSSAPTFVPPGDSSTCMSWGSTATFGLYNIQHGALGFGYAWNSQACTKTARVFCLQQ